MIALTSLNSVSFSDCPIRKMVVDTFKNYASVYFDFVYTQTENSDWEPVDEAMLVITNWDSMEVSKYVNDSWITVNSNEPPEYFKEILDVKQQDGLLTLEGFSAQSGYWLKYGFEGVNLRVLVETGYGQSND